MNSSQKHSQILEKIFDLEKIDVESARNYANEMLYGLNSIDLDPQRYFEQILINFARKKEIIIPKIDENKKNKYLYFDINKEWKSVWDIIFLGELIKEEIVNNLNINIDIDDISEKEVIIENLPFGINDGYIRRLKQSIQLIQKLKDSIGHRENNNLCEEKIIDGKKYVSIENLGGKIPFKGKILLNYLEGFINNKIIPLEEDRMIASKTDRVAYPLLEVLGYDPKKIENFFYRTNPTLLNYILDNLNNNYTILYELPINIYNMNLDDLKKLLNHPKVENIKSLIGLPEIALEKRENLFKLLEQVEKIEELVELPEDIFFDADLILELLNHPKVKNLNSLKGIPTYFFQYNDERMLKVLSHPKIDKIESLKYFPNEAFTLSFPLLDLLNHPKIKNIDDLIGLPTGAFYNRKQTKKLLNRINLMEDLENMISADFTHPKLLRKLRNHPKVKDIRDVDFLSSYALDKPKLFMKLLNHSKVKNLESLKKVHRMCFDRMDLFIKLLDNPKVKSVEDLEGVYGAIIYDESFNYELLNKIDNVKNLKNVPINAFLYRESTLELLNHPKVGKVENLIGLLEGAFKYPESTFKLLDHPKTKDIKSLRGLSNGVFEYLDITLKLLDNSQIKNIELLNGLPWEFFAHFNDIEKIYRKYGAFTIEIFKNIPIRLYEKIKIRNFEMLEKIPMKSYDDIKLNNLELLLKRVDNKAERLLEFPDEFFTCNYNMLEEMLSIYNANISKSIFGNYTPKTIYLISYMHTVLTRHNFKNLNDNKEYSMIDLDNFKNVIYVKNDEELNLKKHIVSNINVNQTKYEKTLKYISNIKNIKNVVALNQANKKSEEMIREIKDDLIIQKTRNICSILVHLRNACSHFFFEERNEFNKIRIYDINETGKKTFDVIFDMEDLFKLIKEIESIKDIKEYNDETLISQLNIDLIKNLEMNLENHPLKTTLRLRFLSDLKLYLEELNNVNVLTKKNN